MNAPHVRRLRVFVALSFLSVASFADAQSSGWSPDRGTTAQSSTSISASAAPLHADAVRRASWNEAVPQWQRKPAAAAATPQSTEFTARTERIGSTVPRSYARPTSHDEGVSYSTSRGAARSVATRPDHQFLADYNIRLAEGEKVVGQPTITERGPVGGAQNDASTRKSVPGEVIPVPDDLSGHIGDDHGHEHHDGEVIYEGDHFQNGEIVHEGEISLDPGMEYEHGSVGGCSTCTGGSCADGIRHYDEWSDPPRCPECGLYGSHRIGCGHVARCLHNCLGFLFREASVFAGTQAFKGPLDLGVNGNFGFNEGFNLGGALIPFPRCGLGYQVGARWTQSDLSGSPFGSAAREQVFVTGALFHRAYRGRGLQWGIAYDWLTDNYFTKQSLAQIRTEMSFLTCSGNEFGFFGTYGVRNDEAFIGGVPQPLVPNDIYSLFYRHTTRYGGQGRVLIGATAQSLPVLAADFRVPMSNRCDMVGGFTYVVPDEGQNNNGQQDESWNLSMNIVFYFGRMKEGIHNTPFRPLFSVADNGALTLQR